MVQAWVLGVCVVLCFVLGVDAIRCSKCKLTNQEEICEDLCEVSGEDSGCMVEKFFEGGNWKRSLLICYDVHSSRLCGTTWGLVYGRRYEYHCCSDEDLCNSKL